MWLSGGDQGTRPLSQTRGVAKRAERRSLVLRRQRWARLVLAFWTIPWGVILLADPVTEYLEGRETT
jgi:hypothetical protein